MGLLDRFKAVLSAEPDAPKLWALYGTDHVQYRMDVSAPDPEALALASPLGIHYLHDLTSSGFATEEGDAYQLSWDAVYGLLNDPEHQSSLQAIGIPATCALKPILRCNGTLLDPDFNIGIDGWFLGDTNVGSVELTGPVALLDREPALLGFATYVVWKRILAFYAEGGERTAASNRRHWGAIRLAALAAGARLDSFLTSTVVLSPDKLHIQLARTDVAGTDVVAIGPWFSGAPLHWLDEFDRHPEVLDMYRMVDGEQMLEVVVTPAVKTVLAAIKKMPGRRAAGSLAEKFLSNPFSALGTQANDVIDEEQFVHARKEAGLTFERFSIYCKSSKGVIEQVGLLIETLDAEPPTSSLELFANPAALKKFAVALQTKVEMGLEIFEWRGYRLQLLGDIEHELATLGKIYATWTSPQLHIRESDVFNLERYSKRVTGIGVQPAIVSPHIPRPDTDPWFPSPNADAEAPAQVALPLPDGRTFELFVDKKVYETLQTAVDAAVSTGKSYIDVPGLPDTVTVQEAKTILEELAPRYAPPLLDSPDRPREKKPTRTPREELLIGLNVGSSEYLESRTEQLTFPASAAPRLPQSLRAEFPLHAHQLIGVAWMQHLYEKSPDFCRGALLADDMGLGKTLQLLTLIASALEANPQMAPVLVVAPVSLLENWKNEADLFFQKGTLPLLMLYGDALKASRARSEEIEASLLDRGFTRFLKENWLGTAKIVLTTYETLRDLEFSLAAVHWSLMVCDEAQKIKNPAAMVTRAAKKQNVDFRIACTGTPVENSLADLWCLFDFIQPGLLGALNEFGTKYRRPIECETDEQKARIEELRQTIECQILRRMKADVATLPPKTVVEASRSLPMSTYQKQLYSAELEQYRLRSASRDGQAKNLQLHLLHRLRSICTDPRESGRSFQPIALSDARKRSPKLDWLIPTMEDIKTRNEKVIVFCEFKEMQQMLAHYIDQVFHFRPAIINGDTPAMAARGSSRQGVIDDFQKKPGFGVLILSPVAVGFGVNIQEANHVIHFTRTWNPAKEDQATDRAYRIRQTREVFVYYPVVRAADFVTFDVKLDQLLDRKRSLSGDILNGTGDLSPNDFDDVVGTVEDAFQDRILIDDADTLTPIYFEALIAALWLKQGFKHVWLTPSSGDGGVDTVAKTGQKGELIQSKSSRREDATLGWEAVKDVVGGEASYRLKYPGVQFSKVGVTNRYFNNEARRQAAANGVRLVDRDELSQLLKDNRTTVDHIERFFTSSVQTQL